MNSKIIMTLLLIFAGQQWLRAEDDAEEKKSFLTASINYQTNSTWQGRSDSIISPNIGTSLSYHFKFGGYIGGTLNFFPNRKENILDQSVLQAGYDYSLIKDKLTGSLVYSAYFYSKYSTQVRSEIKSIASAGLTYDANILQWSLNADVDFGNKSDLGISTSIFKGIELSKKEKNTLTVTPTATLYAGTQNLYALYLVNRIKKINLHKKNSNKNPNAGTSAPTELQTSEYSQFNLLDLDLSLPISYTAGQFTFGITPTYAFPFYVQSGEFTTHPFYVNFAVEMKF